MIDESYLQDAVTDGGGGKLRSGRTSNLQLFVSPTVRNLKPKIKTVISHDQKT